LIYAPLGTARNESINARGEYFSCTVSCRKWGAPKKNMFSYVGFSIISIIFRCFEIENIVYYNSDVQ